MKSENYKVGDKVVYPGHGVGEISAIKAKLIAGEEHKVYEFTILSSGVKMVVPLIQAQTIGIRKVSDKKAIEKVYKILKDRNSKLDTQTWNRRFREYSQKLQTGSVYEIAAVFRDLSILSIDKELSFGEKRMREKAETLLVSEISIAKARSEDKVVGELKELFA